MLLLALAVAVGSIRGTVVYDGRPLPGTTVKLTSSSFSASRVSNSEGEYSFDIVPVGIHDLSYELSGFELANRGVAVHVGENRVPRVAMKLAHDPGPIVIACSIAPCIDSPSTPWELPSCKDYEFDGGLIESAKHGDRSAVDLLRQRYATTFTYAERVRIGGVLLGRVSDDRAIWSELSTHAENFVSFASDDQKAQAYCAKHGWETGAYLMIAGDAFAAVGSDRRSRPLLLRALASDDIGTVAGGILGLASQHDDAALPDIEKAVQRFPDLATFLVEFRSEAADRIAMKYLRDNDRADYDRLRCDSPPP